MSDDDKVKHLHLEAEHELDSFQLKLEYIDGLGAVVSGQGAFFSPPPEELHRLAASLRRMATLAERIADLGQVGEPKDATEAGVAYPATSLQLSQVIRIEAVLRQGGMWFGVSNPEGVIDAVAMCRENLPAVVNGLLAMAHFVERNQDRVLCAAELQEEMAENPPEGFEQADVPLRRRLEVIDGGGDEDE
jgi:hypothetical protein